MNITKELLDNEKLIYQTKPHWVLFSPAIFWLLITLFVLIFGSSLNSIGHLHLLPGFPALYKVIASLCFLAAAFYAISAYIQREFTRYIVTTRRVLVKSGMVHRKTTETMARKIEGIQVIQSPLGRMLNYGSVVVVGIGGTQDPFPNIPSPIEFRKKVQILTSAH